MVDPTNAPAGFGGNVRAFQPIVVFAVKLNEPFSAFQSEISVVAVDGLAHPTANEIEWEPTLARRNAGEIIEDRGLEGVDQATKLLLEAFERNGAPQQCVGRFVGVSGEKGCKSVVFRPQVSGKVVARGNDVKAVGTARGFGPCGVVQAPLGVEEFGEPSRHVAGFGGASEGRVGFGEGRDGEGSAGAV